MSITFISLIAGLSVKLTKKLKYGFETSFEAKGGFIMVVLLSVTYLLAGSGVLGGLPQQ